MKYIYICFSLLTLSIFLNFSSAAQGQTKFFEGKHIQSLATNGNAVIASELMITVNNPFSKMDWLIHLSVDGGVTWETLSSPIFFASFIAIDDKQTIYIGDVDGLEKTLLRTKDKGKTWKPIQPTGKSGCHLLTYEDGVLYASFFDGIDDKKEYQSKDQGDTWKILVDHIFILPLEEVYFQKNGDDYFLLGTLENNLSATGLANPGIIRYNSLSNTIDMLPNLPQVIYSFFIKNDNQIIIQGGENGLSGLQYVSSNFGHTWDEKFSFGEFSVLTRIVQTDNGKLYAHTTEGIFCSDDNAETWKLIKIIDAGEELNPNLINKILAVGNTLFVATSSGLIRIGEDIVASVEKSEPVTFGPNPTQGDIKITHAKEISEFYAIDTYGKKVFLNYQKNSDNDYILNTSKLSNGLYSVVIVLDDEIKQIRIIKE
ncbi:MAG: T9SS type A sorting domain-containing protein [Chryseotalea sp.]